MRKIAFDLRVGDIIREGNQCLTITEIKGVHHPAIGCILFCRFARGGWIRKGYMTLRRPVDIVGHDNLYR